MQNTKLTMIAILSLLTSVGVLRAADQPAWKPADDLPQSPGYTVACFYFPNYHVDKRNEQAHGPGWTEWELVKRAEPRFPGHRQPRVPAWGYTDEADPAVMQKKIAAAADHGIDVFIYDWYYYDDGPFLERGLDEGFLKAPNNNRMRFALMWANHDWINIHPAKIGKAPLQYPGKITPATFESMTDHIIRDYFKHPSYWKIDGRPVFSIYELFRLVDSFGGPEKTAAALKHFREKTIAAGFPGLHLNGIEAGIRILPGEKTVASPATLITQLGLDSVTAYVWMHYVGLGKFPETPYAEIAPHGIKHWSEAIKLFSVPYFPNVTMGWDPSPRTVASDKFTNSGYPFMATMGGNTPEAFHDALAACRTWLDTHPAERGIMTINASNEWTEGSYLEPDTFYDMKYLEAVKDVFQP